MEKAMTNERGMKAIPLAVFAAAAAALAFAFIGEYGFGLQPCILCIYERVPYAVGGVIALVAATLAMTPGLRVGLVWACAIVFLAGTALGFYHVGVEEHWWEAVTGCAGGLPTALSIEDLQAQLRNSALKPCDQVDWRLFGLSLAGYNTIFSLALAVCCGLGARFMSAHRPGRDFSGERIVGEGASQ